VKKVLYFQILFIVLLFVNSAYVNADDSRIISKIYAEHLEKDGRYHYIYPEDESTVMEQSYDEEHSGKACLLIRFNPKTYSGAGIGNYPPLDLSNNREKVFLEFWIKGKQGNEVCEVLLLDSPDSDGIKCESGIVISPAYVKVTNQWQKVSIPLSDFSNQGQYWDGEKNVKEKIDWAEIVEFKIAVRPYDKNDNFQIYIDDICIVETQ
jgi:hypothetical protein